MSQFFLLHMGSECDHVHIMCTHEHSCISGACNIEGVQFLYLFPVPAMLQKAAVVADLFVNASKKSLQEQCHFLGIVYYGTKSAQTNIKALRDERSAKNT